VSECVATSRSQAGRRLSSVHPALAALTDVAFSDATPDQAAARRDVVFLALEHGESSKLAAEVLAAKPGLVIDLAADFRVGDRALYERYYGRPPHPELVERFTYGLADVLGEDLRGAMAIAAPGCFATAALLALHPLARVPLAAGPALFGVTGSSGAGALPKPTTHHPARAHNMFAYSAMEHRHQAEVLHSWRVWSGGAGGKSSAAKHDTPRLLTHSGPFVRGIHMTLHAHLAEPTDIVALAREVYAGKRFVRLLPGPPELTHVVGTNDALLHVAQADDRREVEICVAIDNLVKGAAGQAVQGMNLAAGLREDSGLRLAPAFPY
jgi:N-acetyl-gamma-glutamyl-phosphate reductase